MSRILKYPVPIDGDAHEVGTGPIVHVGLQDRRLFVWSIEPDEGASRAALSRKVVVVGTGQEFNGWSHRHRGSVQDGPYMWHVMEVGRGALVTSEVTLTEVERHLYERIEASNDEEGAR